MPTNAGFWWSNSHSDDRHAQTWHPSPEKCFRVEVGFTVLRFMLCITRKLYDPDRQPGFLLVAFLSTCNHQVLCMLPQNVCRGREQDRLVATYCPVIPVSHRQTRASPAMGDASLWPNHTTIVSMHNQMPPVRRLRPECLRMLPDSPNGWHSMASRHFSSSFRRQVHFRRVAGANCPLVDGPSTNAHPEWNICSVL